MFALSLVLSQVPFALPGWAGQIRLLAFGDSLTEGYGLPKDQGLVPRLQDWLRQRGHDVLVVNGGKSGDTTAGGVLRIDAALASAQPDAVLVELGGNDILGNLGWSGAQGNLDQILAKAGQANRPVLLVGIADPRAHARQQRGWAAIWPRLAEKHGALLFPDLYAPLTARPAEEWAGLLQQDGVHASAKGIGLIVDALGPSVETLLARIEAAQ
ncbi:MAG: arylesterase [Paracoccus sp. (in: a-proteobacteria)]|uniref:arylesterase n=1 Tax=Paracoccus sp. TaxID=267 RepID=UPI0039E3E7BC